jgi:type VI secretion system secreted protein Hcp
MAAVDYFLIVDGIKGESYDAKMKSRGAIDLELWSWGESQPATQGSGGGGGAGKVSMKDVLFVMKVNKASPVLMLACAEGRHIKSAELICRRAGKEQQEYYTVKLTDILVSQFQLNAGRSEVIPTEQIMLNFARIEFAYRPQKADGTLDAPVKAGWDVKANAKT